MPTTSPRPIFYILSTHWDREWHLPFQAFRQRMVNVFDHILDGFANGDLKGPFTLDGQCIPVEDYLEVRPERRVEFLDLVKTGKIRLGPWYVMPDEFLISGESHIRNLRLGRQLARDYGGKPSNVGFLCDMFGHISQMPQIFAGFGIQTGFIWRGTNNFEVRHLRWQGADGSELLCYRRNYCDFSFEVRRAGEPGTVLTPESAAAFLKTYIEAETASTQLSPVLLFDGSDHQDWDEETYNAIKNFRSETYPEGIRHTDLDTYFEAVLADNTNTPTILKGELREPSRHAPPEDDQWVIPGCLASRVWIKQANAACEHLLTSWAEPFSVFQGAAGAKASGYLNVAWRWLLQNHPHDSMGGCSVDQVHDDMKHRFSQCQQISENITHHATLTIASQVGESLKDDELRCVVFNSLATPLKDEVIELDLPIPPAWKQHADAHNFEFLPNIRLFDAAQNEIAWTRVGLARDQSRPLLRTCKFPQVLKTHMLRVAVKIDLPACGYTTLTAKENKETLQIRHPLTPGIAVSDSVLDNGLLRVEVDSSGELTLTNHETGRVFQRLLSIEDTGDIGDGWCHATPFQDEIYSSRAVGAQVSITLNTPDVATLRITYQLQIPCEFDWMQGRRSSQKTALHIEHDVTLKKAAKQLEVETRIENSAKDHRVRILFPSHETEATHWLTDAAFDVIERPIALREDNHTYRELEVETKPMQSWMAVHGHNSGLAIVTEGGLLEGAARDLPDRPLALTLFRSTKKTVFTDGEPGGQLLGPLRFRYAIVPLQGAPDRVQLSLLAKKLAGAVRKVTLLPEEELVHRKGTAPRPLNHSFVSIEGSLALSSLCFVKDTIEIRVFNPDNDTAEATINLAGLLSDTKKQLTMEPINFEGNSRGARTVLKSSSIHLQLNAKQIATYRIL